MIAKKNVKGECTTTKLTSSANHANLVNTSPAKENSNVYHAELVSPPEQRVPLTKVNAVPNVRMGINLVLMETVNPAQLAHIEGRTSKSLA
jgi:hypothetical protein